MVKFPLYNECPNCGGRQDEHSENRFNCSCSVSHNTPLYAAINLLVGRSDPEALTEYRNLRDQIRNQCPCLLSPSDVAQAIAIQAAIEVALQRAANGNHLETRTTCEDLKMKYKVTLRQMDGPLKGSEFTVLFEPDVYPAIPHGNALMVITKIEPVQ